MSRSETPGHLAELSREELMMRLVSARDAKSALEKGIEHREAEIRKLRNRSVEVQCAAEVEEERLGHALFRKMDSLRKSNTDLGRAIKAEERRNAAVLAQLARVRKSKVDVENRIEAEQERMLNTLQKQLLSLASEKVRLERQLQASREDVITSLHAEVERLLTRANTPSASGAGSSPKDDKTPASARCSSPGATQPAKCAEPASVVELEGELRKLLDETRRAQDEVDDAEGQCARLADQLRQLQSNSLAARLRMAKMREELDRAQQELAAERASSTNTPLPSSEATPSVGAQNLGVVPVQRRSSHMRTHSGSSVESWSSASVVSSTPLNVGLARQDAQVVRQHTARVLSSAAVYPSPHRGERASSVSRSGRSSAAPSQGQQTKPCPDS